MGRLVFLQFLQKKGWLGVKEGEAWGSGDKNFLYNLFNKANDNIQKDFLESALEPLFFKTLNVERGSQNDLAPKELCDIYGTPIRIPYLNGGLFEEDEVDKKKVKFKAEHFREIFDFFNQYNFTIDETDSDEKELGVDPEMLGKIFENLLEDNKDKGAFYTPKEIVQYMCQESLIAYLTTCVMKKQGDNHKPEEEISESVRQMLSSPEEIIPRMNAEQRADFDAYIRNVKICDPAIGSGAFPMGMLSELFRCRVCLDAWAKNAYGETLPGDYAALKAEIIQNNIYGVDIESGAIDIARLRFWLSIIVDEQTPHALPNFDYKFIQGNSLIPTFAGEYINLDTREQKHINVQDMKEVKKKILAFKRDFYTSSGDKKHQLNIRIKDHILQLISYQLGYEIKSWVESHNTTKSLFPEYEDVSMKDAIERLPAERRRIVELGKKLRAQLADTTVSEERRSQLDIQFFDWRMMFTEVFDAENGGFDIVIGNPPYIRVQNLEYDIIDKLKDTFQTALKRIDISLCFIELSSKIINKNGLSCFITSNQFLTTEYGKAMRAFLLKDFYMNKNLDFGDLPIFAAAMTYVSIFQFSKKKVDNLKYYLVKSMEPVKSQNYGKPELISYKSLTDDNWNLKNNSKSIIFKKMFEKSVSLDNIGHCNSGLITGCDKVLMFNEKDIAELPFEKEILLPVLRAENCSKYISSIPQKYVIYPYYEKDGQTVIYTEKELKNKFPKTYNYLKQNEKILSERKDSRTTFGEKGNWYGLVRFGRKEMFNEEKIISPGEVQNHKFCIDYSKAGFSCARVFAITIENKNFNIKYLLGLLNSNIMKSYIQSIASLKSGGYYQYSSNILNRCPIPNATPAEQAPIIALVEKILEAKKQDPASNTSTLEKQIDTLVYKLYGLTAKEIAIVEG